ncbi:hypothetical protein [Nannocystis punicea]|uniref:Peptidoglycan recognition protein family domain-containing protein n=1 Tax=Nannocystis punicea TaxID=2995304 RepID=A0ABY7GUM4_9BACT|nr:hypothetical protein [Nannocystis poenicansa]WAS90647.1 hypothetical protein O0S08_31045 [Nannocystis poenicansa]
MIDGASFCWTRSHGHLEVDGVRHCVERFSTWRDDDRRGALRVCFVDGQGGSTTAGQGWGGHDGSLLVGGVAYNLNRPALAVRLIRAAMASGWQPGSGRGVERDDGFALLASAGAPAEPRR